LEQVRGRWGREGGREGEKEGEDEKWCRDVSAVHEGYFFSSFDCMS
jgi:hypothetical protein